MRAILKAQAVVEAMGQAQASAVAVRTIAIVGVGIDAAAWQLNHAGRAHHRAGARYPRAVGLQPLTSDVTAVVKQVLGSAVPAGVVGKVDIEVFKVRIKRSLRSGTQAIGGVEILTVVPAVIVEAVLVAVFDGDTHS